jgi:hypothetical protein
VRSVLLGLCAVVTLGACGSSGDAGTSGGADGGKPLDAGADVRPSPEIDSSPSGVADGRADNDADAGETHDSSAGSAPVDAAADSADGALQSTETGDLAVHVVSSGASFAAVEWAIAGPNGVVLAGSVDVASGASVDFVVRGVPAGTGFTITVAATSVDGSSICSGSATFSITAGATTSVSTVLTCDSTGSGVGTIVVSVGGDGGGIELCPTLDGLGASPAEVFVGGSVTLDTFAEAPNPSAIAIAWTAPSGRFMSATGTSNVFTCTSPGVVMITATATDGPGTGGAPVCSATVSVPVTCDANPDADAGSPDAGR